MLSTFGLDLQDVLYAAVLAFCITWFINNIIKLRKVVKAATAITSSPRDIATVMERCYKLFPLDSISFKGETFTRGMQIKVITTNNTDFEGELIGGNTRNMVCIKTSKCIIAHEIQNISNIVKM
jgi:hypothetical protein